jgi:hypothetical protein
VNHQSEPHSAALVFALRTAGVDSTVAGRLKMRVESRLAASFLGLHPPVGTDLSGANGSLVVPKASGIGMTRSAAVGKGLVVACLAPIFALGVVTGVVAERWNHKGSSDPAPQVAAPLNRHDRTAVSPPEPAPEIVTPRELDEVRETKRAEPTTLPPFPSDASSNLTAERSLLDEARKALARGEAQKGLAPLQLHAKRFPKGILTEEREALAVRLLAAVGDHARATSRAENFHRRFPNSLFTPAVDNALASIPRRNIESESNP